MHAFNQSLPNLLFILGWGITAVILQPSATALFAAQPTDYNCTSQQSQIPVAECNTLVALYTSTNGPGWLTSTDWLLTSSPCSWFGIDCYSDNHIHLLSLPDNQLAGPLPNLSALTRLQYLRLGNNQLNSNLPNLSALTNLETLLLPRNQFSGPIPNLSSLTSLQFIDLGDNQLNGAIPDLSTLTQLKLLYLYNNHLSGTIPNLSALSQLEILHLAANRLSGPIPDLSAQTNLRQVDVFANQLQGVVPASVCQAEYVTLSFNKLTAVADPCVDTAAPGWKDSQTVAPKMVAATPLSITEMHLTWEAIRYTGDGGHYAVWARVAGEPAYSLLATTADKTVTQTTLTNLEPHTAYEFVVRTFTPAHDAQQNALTSANSAVATAQTPPAITMVYLPLIH